MREINTPGLQVHERVFVAMSGGVDSSVAAALMVRAGHDVAGITMELLPGTDASADAVASAAHVCDILGIPHHVVDCREVFEQAVVGPFAELYANGSTPNPCVTCNDLIKFGALFEYARELGAETLASGHYARITREGLHCWLERGADRTKDQSYFLYRLTDPVILHVAFPLGGLDKVQVRLLAAEYDLPNSQRAESQDVCFLSGKGHAALVTARHPHAAQPGEIVDVHGLVMGQHRGLVNYTIGQRKGLGIASSEPLYVIALDFPANRLVVGVAGDMSQGEIVAGDVVWRLEDTDMSVAIQTRYRMSAIPAIASKVDDTLVIRPLSPVGAVAPGQAVVCYSGDRVIGGGTIRCVR